VVARKVVVVIVEGGTAEDNKFAKSPSTVFLIVKDPKYESKPKTDSLRCKKRASFLVRTIIDTLYPGYLTGDTKEADFGAGYGIRTRDNLLGNYRL